MTRCACLLLMSTSCAWVGALSGVAAPEPPPRCTASADPDAPLAPPEGGFDVAFLPALEPIWIAGETDTERHVVVGGVRATMTDDRITWARELFAAEVVAAMACNGSWLFVARDGARAMATTFTGDLSTPDDELSCQAPAPAPADTTLRTALMEALLFRRPHWLVGHADTVLWSRVHILARNDDPAVPFQLIHAGDASLVRELGDDLDGCEPQPWGEGFAMVCPGEWLRDVRVEPPLQIAVPAGLRASLFSDDGVHALAAGSCAGGETPFCFFDGQAWRPPAPLFGAPE